MGEKEEWFSITYLIDRAHFERVKGLQGIMFSDKINNVADLLGDTWREFYTVRDQHENIIEFYIKEKVIARVGRRCIHNTPVFNLDISCSQIKSLEETAKSLGLPYDAQIVKIER